MARPKNTRPPVANKVVNVPPNGNGLSSEGGITGVAGNIVRTLRSEPLMLAFMIVVVVFLYFIQGAVSENKQIALEVQKALIEKCLAKNIQ